MANADFRVDAEGARPRTRRALKLIEAWIRAQPDGAGFALHRSDTDVDISAALPASTTTPVQIASVTAPATTGWEAGSMIRLSLKGEISYTNTAPSGLDTAGSPYLTILFGAALALTVPNISGLSGTGFALQVELVPGGAVIARYWDDITDHDGIVSDMPAITAGDALVIDYNPDGQGGPNLSVQIHVTHLTIEYLPPP